MARSFSPRRRGRRYALGLAPPRISVRFRAPPRLFQVLRVSDFLTCPAHRTSAPFLPMAEICSRDRFLARALPPRRPSATASFLTSSASPVARWATSTAHPTASPRRFCPCGPFMNISPSKSLSCRMGLRKAGRAAVWTSGREPHLSAVLWPFCIHSGPHCQHESRHMPNFPASSFRNATRRCTNLGTLAANRRKAMLR